MPRSEHCKEIDEKFSQCVCCVQMCDEEPVTAQSDFRNDVTTVGKSVVSIAPFSQNRCSMKYFVM